MEHGQQDAEPIGTILSGIATLLRELSDQLDVAAARVDESTGLDARLKKLESWAATAGQDITSLRARMEKVESSEARTALAARPTRAERREAAERAELEAAAGRGGDSATSAGRISGTPGSGTPDSTESHPSSDLVALIRAKDEESAGAASAPVEPDRKKPALEAPEAPARLAPIPRLPAPEVAVVAPTETAAPPEKSEQRAATGSDHSASLAGSAAEAVPSRRLPRANFPRRQPARAESESIGSSLLGGGGRLGRTGPDSGSLAGNDSSLDDGTAAENALMDSASGGNAADGEASRSAEPVDRERDKGVDDSDSQFEESIGARGGAGRAGAPGVLVPTGGDATVEGTELDSDEVDGVEEPGTRAGRRSAHVHSVTDTPTVGGDSGPADSPAETAPQPSLPTGLPERIPSAGSRLPRRAAAFSPSAANGADAGEPSAPHTSSRAERRRLAESDAATPDPAYADSASESAHAAPDPVPVPSVEANRPARSLSSDADSDGGVMSAHSTPDGERTSSRHAGATADRLDSARVEMAPTAETPGPAARALGMTAAAVPDTAEQSRHGAAMSEAAAKQLADGDAPVTEVIPGLSALRHLGSDNDDADEGPSIALPQRGSRRADRREAVAMERAEGTADVGARPHSHGAVADEENLLPQRGSGTAHGHRGTGSLPERAAGDSLPTRHSSGSHAQSEPADNFPRRDSGADAPRRDSGTGLAPQDLGADFPHESDVGLPQRASDAVGPQRDSGTELPQRESDAGLLRRDSGLPQRDSGARISRREHDSDLPQSSPGNGLPRGQSAQGLAHPDAAAPSQRDSGGTLPTREAGNALPQRDASGPLPQRDAGNSLPQRGTSRALPGREAGQAYTQDETAETRGPRGMQLGADDVSAAHEVSGSLPTRDAGAGSTALPRRDPGHAAPPRDAVTEIASDITGSRSAGRHNSGEDRETEDLLAGSGPRLRPSAHADSPARDGIGAPQSDQRDARFGGARPAGSSGRDSWQGELDRLAAETAYVDGDPGGDDHRAASVGLASPPRRGEIPSGVTRGMEPAGITPRPAPAQPNPFGPPTSSLTAGGDAPVSSDMPFDLDLPASRPQVSTSEVAEQAQSGKQRPTIEDNAHVDKLQAMLDELKRNPAGPFGRATNTPSESSGH